MPLPQTEFACTALVLVLQGAICEWTSELTMSGGGPGEGICEKHIAESGFVFVTLQCLDSNICNFKSLLVLPLYNPLKRPQAALLVHGLYERSSTFTRQELHTPTQEEII